MKLHPLVLALGLTPLIGCGGSSGSTPSDTTPSDTSYAVRAVDGYLRNALVWLDTNGNAALDDGEPRVYSGDSGVAVLDVSNTPDYKNYAVMVKSIAGQTIDEDSITESNPDGVVTMSSFLLSAPAGQTLISPFSTLIYIKMHNGLDEQQAVTEVARDLGIAKEDLLGDYIASEQGDIAAKANAIIELAVLPSSELQMQQVMQDNSNLNEQLDASKMLVQGLTAEQRLVKEDDGTITVAINIDTDDDGVIDKKDVFPADATEWLDSDKDGSGDNSDAFPNDATESQDTDKDGTGDNSDAFPEDATEWLDSDKDGSGDNSDAFPNDATESQDTDKDGTGDNSDAFPDDATEWLDTDEDGIGDNTDAYINNPEKSVLDTLVTNIYTSPVISDAFQTPMILDVHQTIVVETFNNGAVYTQDSTVYTSSNGTVYGKMTESDQLQTTGAFTRIKNWSYDFNLDGEAQFIGKALNIGERTATGETYWSYIDTSTSNSEGGFYEISELTFDDVNLSARTHPNDLSHIDIVMKGTVSWTETEIGKTITGNYEQYPIATFDINATEGLVAHYAQHTVTELVDNKIHSIDDQRDWMADGTINQASQFEIMSAKTYSFAYQRPIFARPDDNTDEEYADFNYALGKENNLTSYWFETTLSFNEQGETEYNGKRYVMYTDVAGDGNLINTKLTDADNLNGLLFNEFSSIKKNVSEIEKNEMQTWAHYPLIDHDFTVENEKVGQAYILYKKHVDDIWVGYKVSEDESQLTVDLPATIEDTRKSINYDFDAELEKIDGIKFGADGQHLSVKRITTPSFSHDELGTPRKWYFISNSRMAPEYEYTMRTITLADSGFKEGWLILNGIGDFYLLQPPSYEANWPNWYTTYNRHWFGIQQYTLSTDNIMWRNAYGSFFSSESAAQEELETINTSVLLGTWSNDDIEFQFNSDNTYIMNQISDDLAPDSWPGSESGVYQYSVETGRITVSEIIYDNNGTSGLSDWLGSDEHVLKLESWIRDNYLNFSFIDGNESGTFKLLHEIEPLEDAME